MPIVVGIDGTGSDFMSGQRRDEEYDRAFANSFVRKLCEESKPNRKYLRGPLLLGGDLVDAVVKGRRYIIEKRQAGVNEPILLTGYSRGATGIVNVAMQLKDQRVPVSAMLLFDCVDMHLYLNANEIPNNVGPVLHVRRSPLSGSRPSWGNAATRHSRPDLYREEFFVCTHGGMGGTPWTVPEGKSPNDFIVESGENTYRPPAPQPLGQPLDRDRRAGFGTSVTYKQDKEVSDKVWDYVQPFLREHGFV
jgi:hypothetical protein